MPETISVVIPVHNRVGRVLQAIESALGQTHAPLEVIVVDDHSDDGSADIVRRVYAGRDDVQVLSVRNHIGACGARNMGMALARGEWMAFLDSDDTWEADKLERQLAALRARPDAIAVFSAIKGMKNGVVAYQSNLPAELAQEDLYFGNVPGTTSGLMVRKRALMEVGGFDRTLPSCQDWDLYIRLYDVGPVAVAQDAFVLFDDGDHPRISNNHGKVFAGHRTVFGRIRARVDDPVVLSNVMAAHSLWFAEACFRRKGSWVSSLCYGILALARSQDVIVRRRFRDLAFAIAWDMKWHAQGRPGLVVDASTTK